MQSTPATTMLRKPRPLFARLAPAMLAIGIIGASFSAFAGTPEQNAINAKLALFRADMNGDPEPDSTAAKASSIITAKAPDLLLAIAAAAEDPNNVGISAADFAKAVLEAGDGMVATVVDLNKFRSDKDKIIASVIAQVITSRRLSGDGGAIAAVVNGAFTGAKTTNNPTGTGLTAAGQAAAIGQGLKSAVDGGTGDAIADQPNVQAVFASFGPAKVVDARKLAATSILNAVTGVDANAGAIASFVDGVLDNNPTVLTDHVANAIEIAKLVKKSNIAVGAAIGGGLADLATTAQVATATQTALAKATGLQAAASFVTAAAGRRIRAVGGTSSDVATFASNLSAAIVADTKTKGGIAGGAISAADAGTAATIYANLSAGLSTTDIVTFASLAGVGNDDARVFTITDSARITPAIDKTKLGAAIVAAISLTNPDAADAVGRSLGPDFASGGPLGPKAVLAGNLAKAAKSSGAAGAVAAGVAFTTASDQEKADVAIAANKAASKFIASISMQIGGLLIPTPNVLDAGNAGRLTLFASRLVDANTAKATDIAVGASMANPIYADQVVDTVITAGTGTNAGKIRASAAKIVQAVGLAVDVEEVAEIVTQVSTHFKAVVGATDFTGLKTSTAAAIAAAAAKAVNTKPGVKTANRMDELGEVVSSMVGQLLTSAFIPKATATDQSNLAKLVSGVTASVIKALSKKELVDGNSPANNPTIYSSTLMADLSAAANIAGDVGNTLKAALTAGLLGAVGPGMPGTVLFDLIAAQLTNDIPKLGGKGYAPYTDAMGPHDGLILAGLKAGLSGLNPTIYENGVQTSPTAAGYPTNPSTLPNGTRTGSVIDPETDSRPG